MVGNVAVAEGGGAEAVFSLCFGLYRRSKQSAFEIGMAFNVDLISVFPGKNTALLTYAGMVGAALAAAVAAAGTKAVAYGDLRGHVFLFAAESGGVLYAFDIEIGGIKLYAFADQLRALQGGVAAAVYKGLAAAAADMAVQVGGFIAVAVAFAVVAAGGKAEADAVIESKGNTGIPTALAVFAALLVLLLGRTDIDAVFCAQIGGLLAADIGAADKDVGIFAGAVRFEYHGFAGFHAGCLGAVAGGLGFAGVFLLAVGYRDADTLAGTLGILGNGGKSLAGIKPLPCGIGGGHQVHPAVAAVYLFGGFGGIGQTDGGIDYGNIDGNGQPFLFKAGALGLPVALVGSLNIDLFGFNQYVAFGR